jgi:oligopeptide transport system permease protein
MAGSSTGGWPLPRGRLHDIRRAFHRSPLGAFSLIYLCLVWVGAFGAPYLAPYDPRTVSLSDRRARPLAPRSEPDAAIDGCRWKDTWAEGLTCGIFLLGSDNNGRDLLSLTMYGARTSLSVALAAAAVSLIIGITFGTFSGFAGGRMDEVMMRLVDFVYSVPVFLVVIGIQGFFRTLYNPQGVFAVLSQWNRDLGGLLFLFIAIGLFNWAGMARLARAMVHGLKSAQYVEAAMAIGATEGHIIRHHIVPNMIGPLLIAETLAVPGYIFLEATLSYLGLGVVIGTVSWGAMMYEGYQAIRSNPHIILVPATALTLLTLAFNFLGDSLRDAMDPRLKGSRR